MMTLLLAYTTIALITGLTIYKETNDLAEAIPSGLVWFLLPFWKG